MSTTDGWLNLSSYQLERKLEFLSKQHSGNASNTLYLRYNERNGKIQQMRQEPLFSLGDMNRQKNSRETQPFRPTYKFSTPILLPPQRQWQMQLVDLSRSTTIRNSKINRRNALVSWVGQTSQFLTARNMQLVWPNVATPTRLHIHLQTSNEPEDNLTTSLSSMAPGTAAHFELHPALPLIANNES